MLPGTEPAVVSTACILAGIAGRTERCKMLQAVWKSAFGEVSALTANIGSRPRVLAIAVLAGGSVRVQGPSTLTGRLIAKAGGVNVIDGSGLSGVAGQPLVSAEQVLALEPDVILISPASAVDSAAAFIQDPLWKIFGASRSRRVYREPEGLVLGLAGVIETPIRLRWMAEVFHPKELPAGVRTVARETYKSTINFNPDDSDLDRILSVAANRGMEDAERFEAPLASGARSQTP